MIQDVCLVLLTASVLCTLFYLIKYLKIKTVESQTIIDSYKVTEIIKKEEHNHMSIMEQIQDEDSSIVVKAIRDPGIAAQFGWLEQEEEENIYA